MKTSIVGCKCKSEFQDKRYGLQQRVANHTTKKPSPDTAISRCTICGTEHKVSSK